MSSRSEHDKLLLLMDEGAIPDLGLASVLLSSLQRAPIKSTLVVSPNIILGLVLAEDFELLDNSCS
jgi:hypothetical protein